MIKVENIEVYNLTRAIYSARNPLNSWEKSDSDLENDVLGGNDLGLARRLYKAGTEHRKYARQIFVSMDITAPLYWWKEFDTYKVGTTSNSCSTMHKIQAKEFTVDDFSHENLDVKSFNILTGVIEELNESRKIYNEGYKEYGILPKNKQFWWNMIQLLPSSYNQKRTVTMTYENVFSMIHQREYHKLDEWQIFVRILKDLPYVREITDDTKDSI